MQTLLIETQQAFSNWRRDVHKSRYNSESLRSKAVKCLSYYSCSTVSKTLGVTSKTLQAWKKTHQACASESTETIEPLSFVSLPMDNSPPQAETSSTMTGIQITLPNKLLLTLPAQSMDLNVKFIRALCQEIS